MIEWKRQSPHGGQEYTDIVYETAEGIAKITINRPEVRNAFRPADAVRAVARVQRRPRRPEHRRHHPDRRRATQAFCSGGDQKIRGDDGYLDATRRRQAQRARPAGADPPHAQAGRSPWWPGYAIGGGHVLHVCCDLTIAADNATLRADRPARSARSTAATARGCSPRPSA